MRLPSYSSDFTTSNSLGDNGQCAWFFVVIGSWSSYLAVGPYVQCSACQRVIDL